jgi:thioredoxin 1
VDKIFNVSVNKLERNMDINKDNFEAEVLRSEQTVMVDFWAPWCGPCKVISPIIEEVASEYQGKAKVVKVNVDENNEIAMRYGIMSIPTLKYFKNGNIVGELIGAAPKQMIVAELQKHI